MDILSTAEAGRIDAEWVDAGYPADGLRIVGYRTAGNRYNSLLTVPGNDNAPVYTLRTHNPVTGEDAMAYYHHSGPTQADWQRTLDEQEFMAQWREASQEAIDLYEWASGR